MAWLNKDIEYAAPWKALREGRSKSLQPQLGTWLEELHRVGYWLEPFLPSASSAVLSLVQDDPIRPAEALFPRKR